MNAYTKREVKAATLLVASIQMLWSLCALYPEAIDTTLYMVHGASGVSWFLMQLLTGAALATGALYPRRKVRQMSLFLSSLVWFSMFITLFAAGLITPVTVTMPVLAFTCIALLVCDVKGKPREKVC